MGAWREKVAAVSKKVCGEVSWTRPEWMSRTGGTPLRERFQRLRAEVDLRGAALLERLRERSRRDPRRFWTAVGASAAVLLLGFAAARWYAGRPKHVRFTVTGTVPGPTPMAEVLKPEPVHIDFGGSAARLDAVGKPVTRGISMRPPLAGEWFWTSDRRLTFTPAADWPVGREFTVKLDRTLFPEHVRLERYEYRFRSAPFSAKVASSEFYQDPKDPKMKKVVVTVAFTHPVDTAEFERRVGLKLAGQEGGFLGIGGKGYPFTVLYNKYKSEAYIHSHPVDIPADDTYMAFSVAGGFGPARGGPPHEAVLEGRVPVPGMYTYFRAASAEPTLVRNERYEPEQALILQLTAGALEEQVQKSLKVYELPKDLPAVQGQPAVPNYRWYDPAKIGPEVLAASRLVQLQPLPTDREYAATHSFKYKAPPGRYLYIHLEKGVQAYGGYVLAKDFDQVSQVPEFPRELKIMYDGAILSLSGEKKVSVLSRDIPAVRFELARVLPNQINHLVSQSGGMFRAPEFQSWHFGPENISERFSEVRRLDASEPGKTDYSSFDLTDYLGGSGEGGRNGLFFFKVEGWDPVHDRPTGVEDKRLILVTDLGMLVKKTMGEGRVVFVQSIRDGSPAAGVQVQLLGKNGLPVLSATTDEDGRAAFPSVAGFEHEKAPTAYLARRAGDISFLPYDWAERELDFSRFDVGGAVTLGGGERLQAYLFSDRGIYRPGDEVRVGLIVKPAKWEESLAGVPLEAVVTDARGLEVSKRKLVLSAYGFEELRHKTEEESPTGSYQFSVYVVKDGRRGSLLGSVAVRVEEFIPDRLRITSRLSRERADGWVTPEDLKALVSLKNLFGTPAAGRRVKGVLRLSPSQPSFRALQDYVFFDPSLAKRSFSEQLPEGKTDDKGEAEFALDLSRFEKATYRLHFTAEGFEESGGRSVVSESSVLVSARPYLIGYKPDGDLRYVRRGSQRSVDLIAADPSLKKAAAEGLKAQLLSLRYVSVLLRQSNGTYKYESVLRENTVSRKDLKLPAGGFRYALPTAEPGDYALVVRDAEDTELARVPFTVTGEANVTRSLEKNAELKVQLDKGDYAPGEEIELQITAPYSGAGLITIERDRVYAHRWFKAQTTASTQRIRVPADMEGNGYVVVSFVRSMDSPEIFMSPLSYGVTPFTLSRERRTDRITLSTPELARPGEPFRIRYSAAKPGKIAVFAVDEGILQVAGYKAPDPLGYFFQKRALEVKTAQILDLILPEFKLIQALSAPGGDEGREALGRNLNPFKRKRDKPVAYWSGIVDAGPETRELVYQVPDYFNGTLRVMAVAVAKDALGVAEQKSLVRAHVVLTPNTPVVAAPGDEFEVVLGVANNAEGSGPQAELKLELKTSEHLEVLGGASRTLKVAEGREASVSFRLRARDALGSGNMTFTASHGKLGSRVATDLSVRPPAPYITTLNSGHLKSGSRETAVTRSMYPQYRVLEASVSALPLGLARGLLRYLEGFSYPCTEQLVSQAFPAIVLRGRPEFGYAPAKTEAALEKALSVLRARQNSEGAFGMWAANAFVSDFQTVYALHFLTEAKEKGYAVPPEMLQRGLSYIGNLVGTEAPSLEDARVRAYAAYVLTRNGAVLGAPITHLRKQLDERFHKAWKTDLTGIHMAAVYKLNRQEGQADGLIGAAKLGDAQKTDYGCFYDGLVRDSQLLYILSRHFPARLAALKPEDLERLVQPLAAGGYNTLSSAYAILALDAYATAAGPRALEGVKVHELVPGAAPKDLPLPAGLFPKVPFSDKARTVRIAGDGRTPVFYQVTAAGFDLKLPEKELKNKIEVQREYRDDSGKAVTKAVVGVPLTVRLKIRSVEAAELSHVAVVELLPGGFEIVVEPAAAPQPAAEPAVSEEAVEGGEGGGEGEESGSEEQNAAPKLRSGGLPTRSPQSVWSLPVGLPESTWKPEYADVREDRVVLFGSIGPEAREFVYRIRPTNQGSYAIPPAFSEGMYDRSAQGRGVGGKMTVTGP